MRRIPCFVACFVGLGFLSAALAQSAKYTYDSLNRLSRISYADGTTIVYTFDSAGNRSSQIIANPSIPLPMVGVDKSTLTFSTAVGQISGSQVIAVTNAGGGSLQWDAVATASWLSVTPGSGTNSGAVNVTASAAGMSAGTYNANVMILASASNPSVTIPVIFTVTPAQGNPSISSGGIVSAAGSSPGIARGSVASLYGASLADGPSQATSAPLPRTLGGTQVVVNGVSAPLWYADANQINFQVPFESPLQGQASVVVTRGSVSSSPMNVTLTPYAPSVFTYQRASGVFDPIIVHSADNQLVTPTDLAVPGEYLVVYGTGIGDLTVVPATDAFSPASPPAAAKLTPTATIGGVNAPVSFAGLTPGGIGLAQFNIRVPNNLPSGSTLPLVINFNGAASYPVNLAVKNSVRTPVISTVAAGKGGLALDASGNIYTVSTGNTVRKTAPDGTSSLVAGNGSAGNGGDGGLAVNAQLNSPNAVALDGTNNLYISDYANGRVRVVTPDGRITAFAGNGQYGSGGDGGPASQAQFAELRNLAADQAGDVFIVTALTVRRVGVDGIIRAVAGNPSCYGNYSGDGGPAVNACLYVVAQVALDSKGFLYIADAFNNRVRRVDPTTGVITTFAGNGSSGFSGDGGLATQAQLSGPFGVAVDPAGNVYISDDGNSRVRKVTLDGMITTVVGTGVRGFSGDGGPPGTAQLNGPEDLAFDQAGNLYVFDSGNGLIRKVILP